MKSLLILLAALAVSASLLGLAQSASPSPSTSSAPSTAPAAPAMPTGPAASSVPLPGQPSGPTLEQNMPLIPETIPAGQPGRPRKSGPGVSPGASPTGTFEVEEDIRINVLIRDAQTRAFNDPAVQADWLAAHKTRTDPARYAALTRYYNDLYDRMIKIHPAIAKVANIRRALAISSMLYTRLGDEGPADNPYASPVPDVGGKNPPANEVAPFP